MHGGSTNHSEGRREGADISGEARCARGRVRNVRRNGISSEMDGEIKGCSLLGNVSLYSTHRYSLISETDYDPTIPPISIRPIV